MSVCVLECRVIVLSTNGVAVLVKVILGSRLLDCERRLQLSSALPQSLFPPMSRLTSSAPIADSTAMTLTEENDEPARTAVACDDDGSGSMKHSPAPSKRKRVAAPKVECTTLSAISIDIRSLCVTAN